MATRAGPPRLGLLSVCPVHFPFTRQGEDITYDVDIDERYAHLEGVSHTHRIRVAQKCVSHISLQFELRDCVDWIKRSAQMRDGSTAEFFSRRLSLVTAKEFIAFVLRLNHFAI